MNQHKPIPPRPGPDVRNHMWKMNGDLPWIIAANEVEARHELACSDYAEDVTAETVITQIPDDENVSITFDDLPDGLVSDCECESDTIEEFGCDCGEGNSFTLPAGEMANHPEMLRGDRVIGELD